MSVLCDFKNEYECFIWYLNTRSEKTNKWRNEWKSYGMTIEMKPLWIFLGVIRLGVFIFEDFRSVLTNSL